MVRHPGENCGFPRSRPESCQFGQWTQLERRFRVQLSTTSPVTVTFVREYPDFGDSFGTLIRVSGVLIFAMANGKVDFFNDTGGYGFIETEDSDDDVFFHMEDVGGEDLTEGTEIEFDIEQAPKGPRATNVVRN